MKLLHRFVQVAGQSRHRLRTDHLAGHEGYHSPPCRELIPRKNASRINSDTSSARRWNFCNTWGRNPRLRLRAMRKRRIPKRVTKARW